jgi:hypothetical protein
LSTKLWQLASKIENDIKDIDSDGTITNLLTLLKDPKYEVGSEVKNISETVEEGYNTYKKYLRSAAASVNPAIISPGELKNAKYVEGDKLESAKFINYYSGIYGGYKDNLDSSIKNVKDKLEVWKKESTKYKNFCEYYIKELNEYCEKLE